jgi:trk system potassium uptake protein TrkA
MFVMIIGGGKVGTYLANLLKDEGHAVKLIENRQEEIGRLQTELSKEVVVWGNGTDPNVLEAAGIRTANVVAAVTGADEINLVVTSLARFEFGVLRTIARVNNPKNAWMYTPEMGVDVALNQADLMGHMIAEEMSLGDMMILIKLRKGQFSLVEEKVAPTSLVAGKAIRDLELPSRCLFTAVLRKGEMLVPHGNLVLQPADEILAVVHASDLDHLAAMLARRD